MRYCFFFTSAIFFLIIVQADRITFKLDKDTFKKCIEDYLFKDSDLNIGKSAESIAQIISNRFFQKSYNKKKFKQSTNSLYYVIRDEKTYLFSNNIVPKKLRTALRDALENCVERKNLPQFEYEPRVLSDLLDFILVDWLIPVQEMIRTQDGRSTLRRYAYSAGVRLTSALRYYSMNFKLFRSELLRIWMMRAKHFNTCASKFFYIRHRFTTDRDRMFSSVPLEEIHTTDDRELMMGKGLLDFTCQSQQDMSTISDLAGTSRGEYLPFGISSAQKYLDAHIDQCYGIIFYILELQLRGISSDEDDIYDGIIPYHIVSYYINQMAWYNVAYRNYLATLREHFKNFRSGECFSGDSKEELILILALKVAKKLQSVTTTSTTTSTEVSDYKAGSKKDGTREKNCGKYFSSSKRLRAVFPEQNQQSSQVNNVDYYGYIVYNGDSYQLRLFKKDQLQLPNIVVGVSTALNFSFY